MHLDSVSVFDSNFFHLKRDVSVIVEHAPQFTEVLGLSGDSSTQQCDQEQ
jgi:hypothetical protein